MPTNPPPPPPPVPQLEPTGAADLARQRLAPKSRFPFSVSLPNLRASPSRKLKGKQKTVSLEPENSFAEDSQSPATIKLNDASIVSDGDDDDEYKDKFVWATIYENQRGVTLFSTPYYSSNSLLPSDPEPFTIPSAVSVQRAHQPTVSLKEFPLPDGNWRWVSTDWMVDMRSDSGEVQHDGFEYNWMFRKHHWRAEVGPVSAGGWVRRRRWIRLMMRPGRKRQLVTEEDDSMAEPARSPTVAAPSVRSSWHGWENRLSLNSSLRPSSAVSAKSPIREHFPLPEVWQGNIEEDWHMCRDLMRAAGSDGAKLELWERWLGLAEPSENTDDARKGKQRADPDVDDDAKSSEWPSVPPLEYVTALLREKLSVITQDHFMFPESRRSLIELLFKADVLSEVSDIERSSTLRNALDFWSLNSELNLLAGPSPTVPSLNNLVEVSNES